MPVLVGIRLNPWLRTYYLRLRSAGKRPKVAIIAPSSVAGVLVPSATYRVGSIGDSPCFAVMMSSVSS